MDVRRLFLSLPILASLAACNPAVPDRADAQDDAAALEAEAALTNLAGANDGASDPAEVEARARTALAALLPDAATAPLRNVRSGVGQTVCGEVGRDGGFRGFVVPPDGAAAIARSDRLNLADLDDPYPDLYVRWCASSDELIDLYSDLSALPPPPDREEPIPPPLPLPPVPPISEARPDPPPSVRPPATRQGETRRFSDAVLRPDGD